MRYGAGTMPHSRSITIADLYPDMNEQQLAEAEANLKRFVAVIVRIYDRLTAEGKGWPEPPTPAELTDFGDGFTIPSERSKFPNMRN